MFRNKSFIRNASRVPISTSVGTDKIEADGSSDEDDGSDQS